VTDSTTDSGASDADGLSVTMVATPGDGSCGIGTYARHLREGFDSVTVRPVHVDQDRRTLPAMVALAVRAVRAEDDVVHLQHEYGLFRRSGSPYPGVMGLIAVPLLALFARCRGVSVVVTMHSVLVPSATEAPRRVRAHLYVMHELVALVADQLIFLSTDCAEDFRAHVPVEGATVLPHGVTTQAASEADAASAKAAFGYDPDDHVVVIPGFVRRPKGHDVFAAVAERLPAVEFLIAGGARSAGEEEAFAASIRERAGPNLTMTGVLSEQRFALALAAADLAVLPYRVVSQSGTFNWAVAHHVPILGSDVPYFERMERRWGTVETTPIDDHDALADRIRDLLDSPARRAALAENCRRYTHAHSFDRVADDHRRIYRQAIAGESAPTVERTPEPRAACSAPAAADPAAVR